MTLKFKTALALSAAMVASIPAGPAHAQAGEQYIGQLMMTGFNFCPRDWTRADGQLLPISSYNALFALYGTNFGGDGRTSFGLPDLRGRSPMHVGNGPGLTPRALGQKIGTETRTLTLNNLPSHNHSGTININNTAPADSGNPTGNHQARSRTLIYEDTEGLTPGATMAPGTLAIDNNGGGQAFSNVDPHQVVNFCVALTGIFPSRN